MTAPQNVATDDTLVRELAGRADRALPPMALDPAVVLAGGRRYRRRRAVVRSAVGVVGAAAVVLGGLQLGGVLRGDDDTLEVAQLVTVGDFQVVAATEVVPLEVDGTTVYDTGVPVDPADPDGARWVIEHEIVGQVDLLSGAGLQGGVSDYFLAWTYDPEDGTIGEEVMGGSARRTYEYGGPWVEPGGGEHAGTLLAFGLAGIDYTPHLYLTGPRADVPPENSRVLVPTFEMPGIDGLVYFVRVSGEQPWPRVNLYPDQNVSMLLAV